MYGLIVERAQETSLVLVGITATRSVHAHCTCVMLVYYIHVQVCTNVSWNAETHPHHTVEPVFATFLNSACAVAVVARRLQR